MPTETEIKAFFEGREASYNLFQLLRAEIKKICSPEIELTKTQISFGEEYKYLWVWLPQKWIAKRPDTSLTLTIATGEKLKSKRIVESVQPQKGFWTQHILINNESDIDSEVLDLMKASYEFYLKRKKLRQPKAGNKPTKGNNL